LLALPARSPLPATENLQALPDETLVEQTVSALTGLAAAIGRLEHQNHDYKRQIDRLEVAKMGDF